MTSQRTYTRSHPFIKRSITFESYNENFTPDQKEVVENDLNHILCQKFSRIGLFKWTLITVHKFNLRNCPKRDLSMK